MSEQVAASRQDFLAAVCGGKRRFETVTLPTSKITVRIRSLFQGEISAHQMQSTDTAGKTVRARVEDSERRFIRECVVDAEGNRLLTEADVAALAQADPADFYRLYERCTALCGLRRDGAEEERKNSDATPADASPTG